MSTEERVSYRDQLVQALQMAFAALMGNKETTTAGPLTYENLADAALSVRDAELDRLSQENDRLAAELKSVLNAAADRLDKLPVGGEALKGPYWYRQGVHDAANLLRDWADASGAATTEGERDPDEDGDLQERIAALIGSGMILRVPPQQIADDIEALVEDELRDRMLPVSDIANAEIRVREDAEVEVSRLTAELNDAQRQIQNQWKRAERAEAEVARLRDGIVQQAARLVRMPIDDEATADAVKEVARSLSALVWPRRPAPWDAAALGQPPAEKEEDPSPDHDPATLCPGEPPTKVHTIHLPGDDRQ